MSLAGLGVKRAVFLVLGELTRARARRKGPTLKENSRVCAAVCATRASVLTVKVQQSTAAGARRYGRCAQPASQPPATEKKPTGLGCGGAEGCSTSRIRQAMTLLCSCDKYPQEGSIRTTLRVPVATPAPVLHVYVAPTLWCVCSLCWRKVPPSLRRSSERGKWRFCYVAKQARGQRGPRYGIVWQASSRLRQMRTCVIRFLLKHRVVPGDRQKVARSDQRLSS